MSNCCSRLRQFPLYSKTEPPPVLSKHFKQDVFQKSQVYGRDKAIFALVTGLYRQVLDSVMLHYGAYAWAWAAGGQTIEFFGYGPEYEILQSIAFGGVLLVVSFIPGLPISIYQTFVLEEKHGFNKTTPGLFVADILKTGVLCAALGAPFLAGFLWVFKWAGDRFVPWLMAFMYVV